MWTLQIIRSASNSLPFRTFLIPNDLYYLQIRNDVGRVLTIPIVLLSLTLVSISMLPSGMLLKETKAQSNPRPVLEITSAVDGNGVPLSKEGLITSSNSITIGFSVENPGVALLLFCSLDNNLPTNCGGPASRSITYNDLASGGHFFRLSAINRDGPNPNLASFHWTISQGIGSPPPALIQATQQLIQLKLSMHLAAATDRILDSQLNTAIQFFQHNLKSGACGHLNAFATEVQTFLQVGRLTQAQASQLLQGVQSVESTAGC